MNLSEFLFFTSQRNVAELNLWDICWTSPASLLNFAYTGKT